MTIRLHHAPASMARDAARRYLGHHHLTDREMVAAVADAVQCHQGCATCFAVAATAVARVLAEVAEDGLRKMATEVVNPGRD